MQRVGKRGPKPKPTALRLLEGNPGRLPINPDEIVIGDPPIKPNIVGMDAHASAEWDRLLASMPPGLYTSADTAALTQYALAWSMLLRSQEELDARGLIIETSIFREGQEVDTHVKVNPAAKSWKLASETLWKAGDRLGLNPGVRARLQVPKRDEKPQSRFGGLIKQA